MSAVDIGPTWMRVNAFGDRRDAPISTLTRVCLAVAISSVLDLDHGT